MLRFSARRETPGSVRLLVVLTFIGVIIPSSVHCADGKEKGVLPTFTPSDTNRVITKSCKIAPGVYELKDTDGKGAVRIVGDNITVDFSGAVIQSCEVLGAKRDTFDGTGIMVPGRTNVTVKNAVVRGFRYNIRTLDCEKVAIENCDASYCRAEKLLDSGLPSLQFLSMRNLDDWRGYGSGIWVENANNCTVRKCHALYSQNGLIMVGSDNCLVTDNDFSFNSGWGIAIWDCSDNVFSWNHTEFVNRICGFYFGEDSTGVALNNNCNRNYFVGNSITHSGDGFFLANYVASGAKDTDISTLPKGASNDNIMAHNDASWSPCNAFEGTFSYRNVYYKNWANYAANGFWLGYVRDTLVLDNEIMHNTTDGVAIEHGSGNRIEKNVLDDNGNCDLHLWAPDGQPTANHPSTDFEVRDNTIRNSRQVLDLANSTDYFVGDNTLVNAEMPKDLTSSKSPDKTTATKRFLASPQYKKVRQILSTRPRDFEFYRDTVSPFGMQWFHMDEYSPRDFRDQLAAYANVGWTGIDLFIFDPKGTKVSAEGQVMLAPEKDNANLIHVTPAAGATEELVHYAINLSNGEKSQVVKGDLIVANWKQSWYRWDGKTSPGDPGGWDAFFAGKPLVEQTVTDTTWTLLSEPPKAVASRSYAVEASARIKFPAGTYNFAAGGKDGYRITIDGAPVSEAWQEWGSIQPGKVVQLKDGVHEIVIQHVHGPGPTQMRLFWTRLTD